MPSVYDSTKRSPPKGERLERVGESKAKQVSGGPIPTICAAAIVVPHVQEEVGSLHFEG